MTAILAYTDGKNAWMAGDSAINENTWRKKVVTRKKVFKIGESMLVGGAGLVRTCQVVEKYYAEVAPQAKDDACEYMLYCFVPEVKRILKEHDAVMEDANSYTTFVVAVAGQLFEVAADMSVSPLADPVFALGHGGDLALGAFLMGRSINDSPEQVIAHMLMALRIASERNLTVAPPFCVEKV